MAKKKDASKKTKSDYVPAPQIPDPIRDRYVTILEVLSGATTVAEAARRLGLSRNRFQTLMHRAQAAMIDGLEPKPAGRPKQRTEDEAELEKENERLQKENQRLQNRVETIDRLLGVAGDLLKGRAQVKRTGMRSKKSRSTTSTSSSTTDEEQRQLLEAIRELRELGLKADLAAAVAGIDPTTAARWARRERAGQLLVKKRGPSKTKSAPSPEVVERAAEHVRRLRGLVGAESLRRTVPELSRREAATIKSATLTAMERDRKANSRSVHVAHPGLIRGFDAMHVGASQERNYLLACADGSVPYRTTLDAVPAYCSHAVAETLERDFSRHGAPLVIRLDRAIVHRTPEVREVLDAFGVLILHGPPYFAPYYGQLERQNREHRAWLRAIGEVAIDELRRACEEMQLAFNEHWRRGTLGFRTAGDMWAERTAIVEDREALRLEVNERRTRLLQKDVSMDLAERLAVEQTLIARGHLSIENRGRC